VSNAGWRNGATNISRFSFDDAEVYRR
jgi:hypothetical protein